MRRVDSSMATVGDEAAKSGYSSSMEDDTPSE
jgi:hypothetical protein